MPIRVIYNLSIVWNPVKSNIVRILHLKKLRFYYIYVQFAVVINHNQRHKQQSPADKQWGSDLENRILVLQMYATF